MILGQDSASGHNYQSYYPLWSCQFYYFPFIYPSGIILQNLYYLWIFGNIHTQLLWLTRNICQTSQHLKEIFICYFILTSTVGTNASFYWNFENRCQIRSDCLNHLHMHPFVLNTQIMTCFMAAFKRMDVKLRQCELCGLGIRINQKLFPFCKKMANIHSL